MRDINETRAEIDSIDDQIIELFKRRMEMTPSQYRRINKTS